MKKKSTVKNQTGKKITAYNLFTHLLKGMEKRKGS